MVGVRVSESVWIVWGGTVLGQEWHSGGILLWSGENGLRSSEVVWDKPISTWVRVR